LQKQFPDDDIQTGVNLMAGRPRKTSPKVPTQAENLLKALDFVSYGIGEELVGFEPYVRLSGKMLVSFQGQIAAGHPIEEELTIAPVGDTLRKAIAKSGNTLTIVETPGGQLSIQGEKIKVLIPAIPLDDLPLVTPDEPDPRAVVSNSLKQAFKICGTLVSETAERVVEASLLLEANVCTGTNGVAMLQCWHGHSLPPNIIISKLFAEAIAKQTANITGVGFSWRNDRVVTFTVWFDNGGFIKTQCYEDNWPDITKIIDVASFAAPILPEFFTAIEAMADFSDSNFVWLANEKVQSHASETIGAQYQLPGLQGGKNFNAKLVKQIAPYAKTIDLTTHEDRAFFFGGEEANPVRGVIMCGAKS
jgi:hypothetical protein